MKKGEQPTIFVLGAGAVGLPLAVFLQRAGRKVVAVRTSTVELDETVGLLSTEHLPFHAEEGIEPAVWKKVVVNAVFNSLCPLLEVDNGIFAREAGVAAMAREIVRECLSVTDRLGLELTEDGLMAQIGQISRSSDGQLISILQDLRRGLATEIEYLNLAIARKGSSLSPPVSLPRTELLGRMVLAKSAERTGKG